MEKNNLFVYPAVFDNEGNEDAYTVTFPNVPDTVAQGNTLEEAFNNAPDALGIALLDYPVYPKPTSLLQVQKDNPGKPVSLVQVDMRAIARRAKNATIRKNVTVPQLLAEEAEEKGLNFSAVLTEALQKELG